jgi:hypothetical protein
MKDAALVSVTLIAIGLAALQVFPNRAARAQSFSREDLDCAVAAKIEDARADKGTTGVNSFHELFLFLFVALMRKMTKPIGQGSFMIDPN